MLHTKTMFQVHSNKTKQPFLLKGLSLEDKAVLGKFCVEYYLVPLSIHKVLLMCYEEEMKQISTRSANPNIFFGVIFDGTALNLKTFGPFFSSFNPMSILAICCKR